MRMFNFLLVESLVMISKYTVSITGKPIIKMVSTCYRIYRPYTAI